MKSEKTSKPNPVVLKSGSQTVKKITSWPFCASLYKSGWDVCKSKYRFSIKSKGSDMYVIENEDPNEHIALVRSCFYGRLDIIYSEHTQKIAPNMTHEHFAKTLLTKKTKEWIADLESEVEVNKAKRKARAAFFKMGASSTNRMRMVTL